MVSTEAAGAGNDKAEPTIPRPFYMLAVALVIGFLVETLLHRQPLGLGYAAASLAVSVGWLVLGLGLDHRPSRSVLWLLAGVIFYGAMVAVRASVALRVTNVMVGLILLLLIGATYVRENLPAFSVSDHFTAVVGAGIGTILQPVVFFAGDLPQVLKARGEEGSELRNRFGPIIVGIVLAIPLLLIFGALFASADPVFATYLRQFFDWQLDLQDVVMRCLFGVLLSWAGLGLARHAFTAEVNDWVRRNLRRPRWLHLPSRTVITALLLLNLLFVSFVVVQAVYLFGGADTLARTHLTHSTYARRGFFELVAAAALVVNLILLFDWLVAEEKNKGRRLVNVLHGFLVILTLAVLVSALQRMRLYQREYGLTELRFYTTAFMGWVAVILLWLVVTVIARLSPRDGRERQRFALGAFVTALILVAVINLVNPDAIIARTNLRRVAAGATRPPDVEYLTMNLSPDTIPTLIAELDNLSDLTIRSRLACKLAERAEMLVRQSEDHRWRGLNLGTSRALWALHTAAEKISNAAQQCPP